MRPSLLLLTLALTARADGPAPETPPVEVTPPLLPAPGPPLREVSAPPTPTPGEAFAGSVLAAAPSAAPGRVPPRSDDPLAIGRERYAEADPAGTVAALTPWLEGRSAPWGRARTAGHLLLGMAHFDLENWNLASLHFYRVRRTGGPLASFGAWYEALVDHRRGRHTVAIRECKAYREKWPDGPHADECLLLIGDAWSAAGRRSAAIAAYGDYLERHPDSPRKEEIRLATALATARAAPARGIGQLHELALDHAYPSTDLAVQAELKTLAEAGHEGTAVPTDPSSLMRRTASLRRSGQYEAAWELFNQLAERGEAEPVIGRWVEDNEERYAWGTRNYDVFAGALAEDYAARPDPDVAWRIFVAWSRAGEWAKAAEWGRTGLEAHAGHWRWRSAKDDMAWATMLAGEYPEAAERWGELAKRGGAFGRKSAFYESFSLLRGGDAEGAVAGFTAMLERRSDLTAAAHYWRAQAHDALGDETAAANDRALARVHDDDGWYGLLLDNAEAPPRSEVGWVDRGGRWGGPQPAKLSQRTRPERQARIHAGLWPASQPVLETASSSRAALLAPEPRTQGWANLTWSALQTEPVAAPATVPRPAALPRAGLSLPDAYPSSRWYDRDTAAKDFLRFSEAYKGVWPRLPAAYDLAQAGLYTDAARVLFEIYEEWRVAEQAGGGASERQQQIQALELRLTHWRPYLLLTRDHYHAARACWGLEKYAENEPDRIAALRLGYPLVRPELVWQHSQRFSVDPYLVYGIMRQESTYRNAALSPVGAIGLIQVMPATGAKVAALLGEHRYSPGQLEDPTTNLRFGIYYFSRLLDRFDGVFPLAVASYNGGPHNVSRWYKPWHDAPDDARIPLDAFVETIQYDETRDYVKRVSGHYARYIAIYEGQQARVVLPPAPLGDDASVIDF